MSRGTTGPATPLRTPVSLGLAGDAPRLARCNQGALSAAGSGDARCLRAVATGRIIGVTSYSD